MGNTEPIINDAFRHFDQMDLADAGDDDDAEYQLLTVSDDTFVLSQTITVSLQAVCNWLF